MKLSLQRSEVNVPIYFVERLMPKANGAFVKVYMYSMYLASVSAEVTMSRIAADLNLLESDVVQAFNYWEEHGALVKRGDGFLFVDFSSEVSRLSSVETASEQTDLHVPVQDEPHPKKSESDVMEAITDNQSLSDMINLSQQMLGKPLTPADVQTLYWFYDELKFSPEVILMLLEHCVDSDKRNMNYIEKVAISWHQKGINTLEKAEKFIEHEPKKDKAYATLKKIFGISDRPLASIEENYLDTWMDEYEMSEDMIALAYEYCIIQTNKLSFPYIDKIIKRWYAQDIHTVPDAERDNANFKSRTSNAPQSGAKGTVYNDSYEHDSMEDFMWDKLNK